MSTHNMFLWRNKKNINTFGLKKAPYLVLYNTWVSYSGMEIFVGQLFKERI